MTRVQSLRQSIGAHFVIGLPGPDIDAETHNLLKVVQPGGIILFARNLKSPAQIADLTRQLRSILGQRVLMCIDHEGGRVNRLSSFTGTIPSAQQLTILNDPELAREHGAWCARVLRILGFNLNLAPVLDLLLKPNTDNSVPDRCWGRTAPEVTRLAGAFLHGMQKEGVLGCGKHFPGYGGVEKDPHLELPRIERTARELFTEDMDPYRQLISAKPVSSSRSMPRKADPTAPLRCVMISHGHTVAFDPKRTVPALLSHYIVERVLRRRLKFNGVIISDDLEMGAIIKTMTVEEAAVKTMANGVDLPLICHTPRKIIAAFEACVKGLEKKKIQPSTLLAARKRITAFKARFAKPVEFKPAEWQKVVEGSQSFTEKALSLLPEDARELNLSFRPVGETYTPKYED